MQEEEKQQKTKNPNVKFTCPNCGEISQDDVIFLCNTCKQEELVYKNGMYICPACLVPGDNFECFSCGSKEVKMQEKRKPPFASRV